MFSMMKKLGLGALFACALVACGGGGDIDKPAPAVATPTDVVQQLRARALAITQATPVAPEEAARQLMDFAEANYAVYFPTHPITQFFSPFVFRYYPATGVYLGVVVSSGSTYTVNGVYVMGGPFGEVPMFVGPLSNFITPVAPPSPGFELQIGSSSVRVSQDSNGLLRVRVARLGGFSGPIEIGLVSPPGGVGAETIVVASHEDEARLPLRIGAEVPLGVLSVVLSGHSGTTTATASLQLDVQPAQPRSQALIQAALAAGQINLGTSLLYRAYAVFGSSRLPQSFVGSGPTEEDIALFADIERERPNLPQSIIDLLQPFLVRPDDPRSIFNLGAQGSASRRAQSARERPAAAAAFADRCPGGRREWISTRSTLHPVRALALCLGDAAGDLSAREHLMKVIAVVDKVYGLMTSHMGPAKPDLWADDAIDVYVVPPNADAPREGGSYAIERVGGAAFPQPPLVGSASSGHVMLPASVFATNSHHLLVIHELFHVLQFAHSYKRTSHWFTEASAQWSEFHFNRKANIDLEASKPRHKQMFGPFQQTPKGLLSTVDDNPYHSYVWPLFMEQEAGAASIAAAWTALENAANDEQATDLIDALLSFKDNFRKFALRNLNKQYGPDDPLPEAKRYVTLDRQFPDGELLPMEGVKFKSHTVAPGAKAPLNFGRAIEPLSAVYFQVTVADATLKKVVFDLGGLQGGGLDVDALVMIDGKWEAEPRNLNGKSELTFCLDDPKEKLWRIEFIVSNHQKRAGSRASAELGVTGETTPCNTVWAGSTTHVVTSPGLEVTVTAEVVFEFDDAAPPGPTQPFRLRSGNWTYHLKSEGFCPFTGRGVGLMVRQPLHPYVPGSTNASLVIYPNPAPGTYSAAGATAIEYRLTDCRGNEETAQGVIGWLQVEGPGEFLVQDDGNTLNGSSETISPEATIRHRWSFTRQSR